MPLQTAHKKNSEEMRRKVKPYDLPSAVVNMLGWFMVDRGIEDKLAGVARVMTARRAQGKRGNSVHV